MKSVFLIILLITQPICALPYTYNSENGWWLLPHGQLQMINLYINVIYDVTPEANPKPASNGIWNYTTIEGINNVVPTYINDFIDNDYIPTEGLNGLFSKLYFESSLERFVVLGDAIVVNIKQSRINSSGNPFNTNELINNVIDLINDNGGLEACTYNNSSSISEFDRDNDDVIDYLMITGRNFTNIYGGIEEGSGFTSTTTLFHRLECNNQLYRFYIYSVNPIGDGNLATKQSSLPMHEFSHSLFGSNAFHTSGGNHYGTYETNTFMGLEGGYGLMEMQILLWLDATVMKDGD